MSFLETLERARTFLERHRRVSLRALRRELALDPETLAELSDELVQVQHVAVLEGDVLIWVGGESERLAASGLRLGNSGPSSPTANRLSYTPKHLAEKIVQSKSALE